MKMKKVAILTFFNRMNYGADLQAYALHKKVKDLGYDCEILDVLAPNDPCAKRPQIYKPLASSQKMQSIKNRINKKIVTFMAKILGTKNAQLKKEKFEQFKKMYMAVSERKFASVDDLYCHQMLYDIFITGSDQVWSPKSAFTSPEPYFLTFVSKDKKKISYAPSFGVSEIPQEVKEHYKQWLTNIDFLSVRENQGAEMVRNIAGRIAEVVLDPTLLLTADEWNQIAVEPKIKKPYILLYDRINSSYVVKLAYHLSKKTGCSIVRIPRGNSREGIEYKIKNLFDIGPSDFLGLFHNASFVLTSSFHGTAFAINYNKPFYSILRKGYLVNSRIINILDNLRLASRLLYVGDSFPNDDYFVNFSQANVSLHKEREKSLAFLTNALEI
ncbi:MAG: polysaccharide pyruvyl transferase family protein [Phycisphaerales bacterium]